MPKTQLKKLIIEKFRALNDVEIEFGEYITVICGKNGTSKSSILGTAAQIFSFEKNYETNQVLDFQQIAGETFKSQYKEHFRISGKFDVAGSMKVNIELHDGYTDKSATAKLELMKRGKLPRPVVRNNSTATGNKSRNFTHPVIFLSLKRLYPIAARKYSVSDFSYLENHKANFIDLANELLNRESSLATGTNGTINSAVAHGENYDHESVSAGEDNAGQIIMALMSFKKLKEEYLDYKGGLLLIDEADAGLFPTAQLNLLKILERECKALDLQVVMTTHSPVLIEYAFEQSKIPHSKRYKTIYLSNSYGSVQVMQNWSWRQISADINTQTVMATPEISLPKIRVYFEDKEAIDFFLALMKNQEIFKFIEPMYEVSVGCKNYIYMIERKVPEFAEDSIICLDADQIAVAENGKFENIVILPGALPPDQLIFEFLYNLPTDHEFWRNEIQFTRDVFTNTNRNIIKSFSISGNSVNIKESIALYNKKEIKGGKEKPRDIFKNFYNEEKLQVLVSTGNSVHNPWHQWIKSNSDAAHAFSEKFKAAILRVMKKRYLVDPAKLSVLEAKAEED